MCFLAFDGHLQGREAGAGAAGGARALPGQGEADPAAHPRVEALTGSRGAGKAGLCGQRADFAGAVRPVRPEPQAAPSGF